MFRKTTLRRAVVEGVILYVAGLLLALPLPVFWPVALFVPVILLRMTLFVLPPVWAALRVVSTKREKMSRRFWRLGPMLAAWCAGASALLALTVGETSSPWGGLAMGPALGRFVASGQMHLSPPVFFWGQLLNFGLLATYFTIAVVCTRLANGGFLRFTMPAGKGRVTL